MAEHFDEIQLIEGERQQLVYKFSGDLTVEDFQLFADRANEQISNTSTPVDFVLDIREVDALPNSIVALKPAFDTLDNGSRNFVYSVLITPKQDKFVFLFNASLQASNLAVRILREEDGVIEAGKFQSSVPYRYKGWL